MSTPILYTRIHVTYYSCGPFVESGLNVCILNTFVDKGKHHNYTGKTYLVSCCYYYYFFSDNEKEGLIKKSLRSDNVEHTHNWVLLRSRATSSASRETISNMPTMHNFSSTAVSLSKTSSSSSFCFWKPLPLQHHLLLSFFWDFFWQKSQLPMLSTI